MRLIAAIISIMIMIISVVDNLEWVGDRFNIQIMLGWEEEELLSRDKECIHINNLGVK
jgi:hypothetical protein